MLVESMCTHPDFCLALILDGEAGVTQQFDNEENMTTGDQIILSQLENNRVAQTGTCASNWPGSWTFPYLNP